MNTGTGKTALLILDVQNRGSQFFDKNQPFIDSLNNAIETARSQNFPIIFTGYKFREGAPEINPNNKLFNSISFLFKTSKEGDHDIYKGLKSVKTDFDIKKMRNSGFSGSELEVLLKSLNCNHIIICGFTTSGAVLSTVREAADKDYRMTVISDCCADADEEVHKMLMEKIFTKQADVMTCSEWEKSLK